MIVDMISVLVTRFAMRFANFIVLLVLVHALTPAEFGYYGYAMASLVMMSIVAAAGQRQTIALILGKDDHDHEAALAHLLIFYGVLALVSTGVMVLIMTNASFAPGTTTLLLVLLTMAPALALRMGQGIFVGLGQINRLNQSEMTSRAILLGAVLLLWLTDRLTLGLTMAAVCLSHIAAMAYLGWQIRSSWPRRLVWRWGLGRFMLRQGIIFAGGFIGLIMLGRVGVWIVDGILGAEAVGRYFGIVRLSEMVAEVATAIGVVIFSHGVRADDSAASARATVRTARSVTALLALLALGLCLAAEPLLAFTMGPAYAEVADGFRFLVVGATLSCFSMMLFPSLSAHGHAAWGYRLFGLGTLQAALLAWPLTGMAGVEGAALAMASAQATVALAFVLVYRRVFDLPLHEILLPKPVDLACLRKILRRPLPDAPAA